MSNVITIEKTQASYNHEMCIYKYATLVNKSPKVNYMEIITSNTRRVTASMEDGIGILDFLHGKNYFFTGATGFLGKVLIEKMLRASPDVGKIFLLIKAKNHEEAMNRIKTEIVDNGLFECLKKSHGDSYESFMRRKLVPVLGNVCACGLGIDYDTTTEITKEIDVILNSAANTAMDERYDVSLDTNTKGPARLLEFAKKCRNLKLFLHISTAYVHREKQGICLEKPFCMDQMTEMESFTGQSHAIPVPFLDVDTELKLVSSIIEEYDDDKERSQKIKDLGMKRAKDHGWRNAYEMTKTMGEILIDRMRGNIPTVIVRPTIIESTYREPFPGWIEGYKVLDPVILSHGQGRLPGFIGDPNTVFDIIPADMTANAIITMMAKHGTAAKPELAVYQIASSVANPVKLGEIMEFAFDYFKSSPLMEPTGKKIGIAAMKYLDSIDRFSSYIRNETIWRSGITEHVLKLNPQLYRRKESECNKRVHQYISLAISYEPYALIKARFDMGNTRRLMEEMSLEEHNQFGFDIQNINWKNYFENIHLPGLRRYVLKEVPPAAGSSPTSRL